MVKINLGGVELTAEYITNEQTEYFQGVPKSRYTTKLYATLNNKINIIDISSHDYVEDLRKISNLINIAKQF